jgi:hypothetical protein
MPRTLTTEETENAKQAAAEVHQQLFMLHQCAKQGSWLPPGEIHRPSGEDFKGWLDRMNTRLPALKPILEKARDAVPPSGRRLVSNYHAAGNGLTILLAIVDHVLNHLRPNSTLTNEPSQIWCEQLEGMLAPAGQWEFLKLYVHEDFQLIANEGPAANPHTLRLIDGGFEYRGMANDLTGRPRAMLESLLTAAHHRCTIDTLRGLMNVNDEDVNFPEQVIRGTASTLRAALRAAVQQAGLACPDPLPSTGRGKDLTYRLEMP